MENSLLPISKPVNYLASTPTRKWELSYGGKDKFYLTDTERNAFLKAIYSGSDTVQVGQMTLTKFFKYIVPIKQPTKSASIVELVTISEEQRLKNIEKIKEIKDKFK
ncbi:MAG: hypothetical protein WC479_03165 [Candidatus Izemoplasmatales bacterium]